MPGTRRVVICGRENVLAVMAPTERAGEPSPEGDADGPAHGAGARRAGPRHSRFSDLSLRFMPCA